MVDEGRNDLVNGEEALRELLVLASKAAERIVSLARRARKADSPADPSVALRTSRQLRELTGEIERIRNRLETVESELEAASETQFLELESVIRDSCGARGWRVDGQWPTLYVEHAIPVEIDERRRTVAIGGTRMNGTMPTEIVAALAPLVDSLFPRNFSASAFIDDLAQAYDGARASTSQVPIFDVYQAFVIRIQRGKFWRDAKTEAFQGMSADQFRARLSRMLEEGRTSTSDGRELRLVPPLNPKDGLFLYQPAELRFGFVGRIEFVSSTRGEYNEP